MKSKYGNLPIPFGLALELVDRQATFHVVAHNFISRTAEQDLLHTCLLGVCAARVNLREELVERLVSLLPELPGADDASSVAAHVNRQGRVRLHRESVVFVGDV